MIDVNYFKERFEQNQATYQKDALADIRLEGFKTLSREGFPTLKNEEWKYTGISSLFNKDFQFNQDINQSSVNEADVEQARLPGHTEANELFFCDGTYKPQLSTIRSKKLVIQSLQEAVAGEYQEIVKQSLGHSNKSITDGIHALNTSFISSGTFIYIPQKTRIEHPLYIHHIMDARANPTFSQPRILIYAEEGSKIQIVETYTSLGASGSFYNEVIEITVNEGAILEYYKIQNDTPNSNHVGTTHFWQKGRSYVHTLTLSLDGGMIRNNTNLILDAEGCESHLYGLYLLKGRSHVDNHTLVDNRQPYCISNELYKGILDDYSTGVFNGKIKVEPKAQKTNAYQSNKNLLLSDRASINTKPQLEIFADDVKCSHGCTVGTLDENALFYLRARGIPPEYAKALLLKAFSADILSQIKPESIRQYAEKLISNRLSINEE